MRDGLAIAIILVFFVSCFAYMRVCDALASPNGSPR